MVNELLAIHQTEKIMQVSKIPSGTTVYSTLARCCKYQQVLPGGVAPVFNNLTEKKPVGFAKLSNGTFWTVA
jgi:hypothetical protein